MKQRKHNIYPGKCCVCEVHVAEGVGWPIKIGKKWAVICVTCNAATSTPGGATGGRAAGDDGFDAVRDNEVTTYGRMSWRDRMGR